MTTEFEDLWCRDGTSKNWTTLKRGGWWGSPVKLSQTLQKPRASIPLPHDGYRSGISGLHDVPSGVGVLSLTRPSYIVHTGPTRRDGIKVWNKQPTNIEKVSLGTLLSLPQTGEDKNRVPSTVTHSSTTVQNMSFR